MNSIPRYLLVTHIPFARTGKDGVAVDSLWARDLAGLAHAAGPIRVAAPQLPSASALRAWGPNVVELRESAGVTFCGFPAVTSPREFGKWKQIRTVLRREVEHADVVHSSNLFPPYVGLSFAHDLATRLGKKTVFVIAEDFHDMLAWELVRAANGMEHTRRRWNLYWLERRVRRSAATASVTLLHTPAAVKRYRLSAARSFAIRQPCHELEQVVTEKTLEDRLLSLDTARPLRLIAACRHSHLKGLDLLLRAIALLARRGIRVDARFFGQGPESENLRQLASALGITGNVEFPGTLPAGPELYAALQTGDLFLMAHRTNDFGRAFFDAMAAALPVLAFRTSASEETVYDGIDGFLTPLDDIQGLAERISLLHHDRTTLKAAARAARRRALENTRSEWFRLRAEWTMSILAEAPRAAA